MIQFKRMSDFCLVTRKFMRKIRAGSFSVFLYFTLILGILLNTKTNAEPMPFSQLPIERQRQIEKHLAPPPINQRDVPYSTPMYYLLHKGYQDGIGSLSKEGKV